MGVGLLAQAISDSTRENGLKLCQRWFRLDIRKCLFTERVMKHWNRQPREIDESSLLEVFKKCVDGMLREWFSGRFVSAKLMVLEVFSNLADLMI